MKKLLALILALATIFTLAACSSDEQSHTDKDIDSMTDEDFESFFEGLDEENEREGQRDQAQETEPAFNPHEPGQYNVRVNPYELGLFEIFGLDSDFPLPKEGFEQNWKYTTDAYPIDSKTGEQPEGVKTYQLEVTISPYYSDYRDEIIDYLKTRYSSLYARSPEYLDRSNYNAYTNDGTMFAFIYDSQTDRMYLKLEQWEPRSLEGTVTNVDTTNLTDYSSGERVERYPRSFTVTTGDGTDVMIAKESWSVTSLSWFYFEFFPMDHLPQVGDTVKVEYICPPEYKDYAEFGLISDSYLTAINYLD